MCNVIVQARNRNSRPPIKSRGTGYLWPKIRVGVESGRQYLSTYHQISESYSSGQMKSSSGIESLLLLCNTHADHWEGLDSSYFLRASAWLLFSQLQLAFCVLNVIQNSTSFEFHDMQKLLVPHHMYSWACGSSSVFFYSSRRLQSVHYFRYLLAVFDRYAD